MTETRRPMPRLRGYGTGPHDGKAVHRGRAAAFAALASLLNHPSVRDVDKLHVYPCGSHWHVGRSTKPLSPKALADRDAGIADALAQARAADLNARIRKALGR